MMLQFSGLGRRALAVGIGLASALGGCTTLQVVDVDPLDASLPDVGTVVVDGAAQPDASEEDGSASEDAGAGATDAKADTKGDAKVDAMVDAGHEASAPEAGADCGPAPPIFTNPATGPFCPFTMNGFTSCDPGEHCCEYAADSGISSTCNAASVACTSPAILTGADWICDEENDCAQGQVCCLLGTAAKSSSCPSRYFGVAVSGSACRASCGASETVICGSQADCSSGTCTQVSTRGKSLGFCRP